MQYKEKRKKKAEIKSHVFRFCLGGKRFYNITCVCVLQFVLLVVLTLVNSGDWGAKSFLIVDKKALNRIVATGSVGGEFR